MSQFLRPDSDVSSTNIASGTYAPTGAHLWICVANTANNEGERAGYNLAPDRANVCTVGWGGQEVSIGQYKCLCK